MSSARWLLVPLTLAILAWPKPALGGGLLPTAPPVNVHTGSEQSYWGLGYLRFGVAVPYIAEPEFSLDEHDRFSIGDAVYDANGLGLAWGDLGAERSFEHGLIVGNLDGSLDNDRFQYHGVDFWSAGEYSGGFAAYRRASARRLGGADGGAFMDMGFTQLFGAYRMHGGTRLESEVVDGWRYIDDYDSTVTGLCWRPVLTLQPALPVGQRLLLIPFVGASAFVYAAASSFYVNQWDDVLYGPDCYDGCPGSTVTADLQLDGFGGFDIDITLTAQDRVALSSLLRPSGDSEADTGPVSEIFLVYARAR
jgi:hypothetical protein